MLEIPTLVPSKLSTDDRGSFSKLFSGEGILESFSISQVNLSKNYEIGTLRGLHYQYPNLDAKIITVLRGSIIDVAVDIRKQSTNFLGIYKYKLSADENHSLYIPKGFAHGFITLSSNTQVHYLHDEKYFADQQLGINALDSELGINWENKVKIISERDKNLPNIRNFKGV